MEKKKLVFDICIENPMLLSTNNMYRHPVRKAKSGRYVSYFTKTQELIDLQEYYDKELTDKVGEQEIKTLTEDFSSGEYEGLSLILVFGLPKTTFQKEDASNLVKSIEDCISKHTKIDDINNIRVTSLKYISETPVLRIILHLIKDTTSLLEETLKG